MTKECKTEAILAGLKFIINKDGQIVSEICGLPPEKVGEVFKNKDMRYMMSLLIGEAREQFKDTIDSIERLLSQTRA
jgi:hypothetical protein